MTVAFSYSWRELNHNQVLWIKCLAQNKHVLMANEGNTGYTRVESLTSFGADELIKLRTKAGL